MSFNLLTRFLLACSILTQMSVMAAITPNFAANRGHPPVKKATGSIGHRGETLSREVKFPPSGSLQCPGLTVDLSIYKWDKNQDELNAWATTENLKIETPAPCAVKIKERVTYMAPVQITIPDNVNSKYKGTKVTTNVYVTVLDHSIDPKAKRQAQLCYISIIDSSGQEQPCTFPSN